MNEQFSEELLSAYVDGELSPQLRAAVERWVENSPDARHKLEDFQRLSRLFGDLPRTEVAGEFSTEVMHLAERRMLLPEAAVAGGRRRFRLWVLALATPLTAAAALLLLTLSMIDNQPKNAPGPMRDAAAARPGNIANRNRGGNDEQPDMLVAQGEPLARDADRSPGAAGAFPPPAAAPASPAGMAGGSGGASSSGAVKAKVALAVPTGPQSLDPQSPNLQSPTGESEQQLQAIHDAVKEIRESGATDKLLLVFRMSVVDRAEGLVLLQKDFADNNIRIDPSEATEGKKTDAAKPVGEASNEGLYVVAEADELIAGFKAFLAHRHPGVRIFVEESIELAALDAESQKTFLAGDDADAKASMKSSPSVAQRKSGPSATNSKTKQPSEPGNPRIEKSASVPVPTDVGPTDDASDKPGSDRAPEARQMTNNARQMVVPAVPPAIQNRAQSNSTLNSQVTRNAARSQNRQTPAVSDDVKNRDAKLRSQDNEKPDEPAPALVRMLIVIEREPPPAAPPADKKGPSGGAS